MKKFLEIARAKEWWEYKLPPMLAVAWLIILNTPFTFYHLLPLILVLLSAITLGAIYVSFLNDATDVAEDARAGKKNRMAAYSTFQKTILVLLPLVAGLCIVGVFLNFFSYAGLFYCAAYIAFTLYSLPPFRLKERGVAGIVADALGSQVFPTLFIAVCMFQYTNQKIQLLPFAALGVWLLCFGLRGILWHQLADKENDKASGLPTVVQNLNEAQLTRLGIVIVTIEIIAFAAYILFNHWFLIIPGLVFYFIYILMQSKIHHIEQILIAPKNKEYRIFLFEYYQVFLPLSVLIGCIFNNPINVIGLVFHCLLFHSNILRICRSAKILLQITITGIPLQTKDHKGN
jgi:4-hydroxybenzoate polyprenyltransferase